MSPSTLMASLSPIGSVSIGGCWRFKSDTLIWDLIAGGCLEIVWEGLDVEEPCGLV